MFGLPYLDAAPDTEQYGKKMRSAVESGNVKSSLDAVAVQSESVLFADGVRVQRLLQRLNELVDCGFFNYFEYEAHDPTTGPSPVVPDNTENIQKAIDEPLGILPRIKDSGPFNDSRRTIDRALSYIRDIGHPADGYPEESDFTRESRQENKVRAALAS